MAVLQRSVAVRRTSATLLKILESEAAVHHTGGLGWPLNTTRFWEAEHSDSESEGDWKEAIILPKVRPLSPVNTELVRLVPRSAVHSESWRGTISSCKSFSTRPPEPLSPPPIIHPWRRVVVEEETEVAIEEAVDEAAEEGVEEIVEEETGPVKGTGVAPKADPIARARLAAALRIFVAKPTSSVVASEPAVAISKPASVILKPSSPAVIIRPAKFAHVPKAATDSKTCIPALTEAETWLGRTYHSRP